MYAFLKKIITATVVFHCLFFQTGVAAFELNASNLQTNGFGSLSLTHGDSDELGMRDHINQEGVFDEWSFKQGSNLGLQLNYKPLDQLEFTFQVLAQDRTENSLEKSVQIASLKYYITPDWVLKLGRFPTDIYMLSEYRNVGYAYLWTKPPVDFYGSLGFQYADGISLRRYAQIGDGLAYISLFAVTADFQTVQNSEQKVDDDFEPTIGLSVEWENDNWRFKYSYAHAKYRSSSNEAALLDGVLTQLQPIWPESGRYIGQLSLAGTNATYQAFGVSYTDDNWVIQSEVGLSNTESIAVNDVKLAYLSVGRKIGSLTPYISVSAVKNDKVDIADYQINPFLPASLNAQAVAVQNLLQYETSLFHLDRKTLSLGFRYDFMEQAAFKFQWDRQWTEEGAVGPYDVKAIPQGDQELDRFTISLDFVF